MLTGRPALDPNYFLAAFGLPHAGTHPVHGRVYPLPTTIVTNSGIQSGDVVVLYCCGGYPGHDREAPAVGVVTKLEGNAHDPRLTDIHYQYLPLGYPIPLDALRSSITGLRTNFSLAVNQLQRVSRSAFRAALSGRQIDWP